METYGGVLQVCLVCTLQNRFINRFIYTELLFIYKFNNLIIIRPLQLQPFT